MPQYLCKLCEAIFVTGRRLDDEGDNAALQMCQLHPNFYSIQQGAERNCYICDTLLATIEYKTLDSGHDFGRDLQETEYWISYGESKSSFLLSIMATFDVNGEAKMDLQQFRIQPSTCMHFPQISLLLFSHSILLVLSQNTQSSGLLLTNRISTISFHV
jgi:hypothetical protein